MEYYLAIRGHKLKRLSGTLHQKHSCSEVSSRLDARKDEEAKKKHEVGIDPWESTIDTFAFKQLHWRNQSLESMFENVSQAELAALRRLEQETGERAALQIAQKTDPCWKYKRNVAVIVALVDFW